MNLPKWAKYVARDVDGQLYAYEKKPYKGDAIWCQSGIRVTKVNVDVDDIISNVKWSDAEPTELSTILNNPIQPPGYRKGKIDLYESWYNTRPFSEFRAIMESIAEHHIKQDKLNRLEDLDKAIYTLQRLREYEEKEVVE